MNLNPMGINGPPSNYQQPNAANPAANANVANFPVGANMLNLTWPIPNYTQPGVSNPPNVHVHNPYIPE
jgi:hypothetical protein